MTVHLFQTSLDNLIGIYAILGMFGKFPYGIRIHDYFGESAWIPGNFFHTSRRARCKGGTNRRARTGTFQGTLRRVESVADVIEILKRWRKLHVPFNNTESTESDVCARSGIHCSVSIVAAFSLGSVSSARRRVVQHNPAPLRGISNDFRVLFYIIAARRDACV